MIERRYMLTKVASGDYLLPGNSGKVIFRLRRQGDPVKGEWDVLRWTGDLSEGTVDPDDADRWVTIEQLIASRVDAIQAALRWELARRRR